MAATCGDHAEYHVAPQQSDNQQGGPLCMTVARLVVWRHFRIVMRASETARISRPDFEGEEDARSALQGADS
jgi:hypothetical protein